MTPCFLSIWFNSYYSYSIFLTDEHQQLVTVTKYFVTDTKTINIKTLDGLLVIQYTIVQRRLYKKTCTKNVWTTDKSWEPGKFKIQNGLYVDLWDMLNNFCFHVYAQKWHICQVSNVQCLCWSLRYTQQLLFLCLGSKVIVYRWKCSFLDLILN